MHKHTSATYIRINTECFLFRTTHMHKHNINKHYHMRMRGDGSVGVRMHSATRNTIHSGHIVQHKPLSLLLPTNIVAIEHTNTRKHLR